MLIFVAVFAFMLIPVWIPLFTFVLGAISDLVKAGLRSQAADSVAPRSRATYAPPASS